MSWEDVVKRKGTIHSKENPKNPREITAEDLEDRKKASPSIYDRIDFGGQRSASVEYINKELRKDVDKLVAILKESPANIFHDVRRDFQEILAKYEEYLRD